LEGSMRAMRAMDKEPDDLARAFRNAMKEP
jgi:hypothetical protein